ncbi:MAG: hypothetical protein ACE5KF_10665 [Kiloniellaceae bacterium]
MCGFYPRESMIAVAIDGEVSLPPDGWSLAVGAPGVDKAVVNIMKWTKRGEWSDLCAEVLVDHLGPACDDFEIAPEDLAREIGSELFVMAVACAIDDFLTRDFEPGDRNAVDDYIRRRGWKESVPGKRYLRAIRKSVMSLYEVTDTVPGSHLFLRDLVRGGDPIRIEDRMASNTAARWDRLAARVLRVNDRNYLSSGLLHFPMEPAEALLGVVRKALKHVRRAIRGAAKKAGRGEAGNGELTEEGLLREATPIFTRSWLHLMLDAARRPMPDISNFDGDELVFCDVRFPVPSANQAEIERRLDAAASLERDDENDPRWQWIGEASPVAKKPKTAKPGKELSFATFDDQGRLSLGMIELRDRQIVLSINSRERAERGKKLLTDLLGGLVGPPLTSFESLENVLENENRPDAPGPVEEIPPDIAAQVIHQHLDRHYRGCMTEKMPVLGNKTPRQAARSKAGRAKLVGWLKYLENGEVHRARSEGQEPYDFEWMWQDLGISDLRK